MPNLALPYVIDDPGIQGNFDVIATQWPNRNVGVFSAYLAAATNLATGTVVPFDTEERDVSNWFDVTTNKGRFTPKVAGYYRLDWMAGGAPAAAQAVNTILYKNGAIHKRAAPCVLTVFNAYSGMSAQVQANGTTDYFEIVFFHSNGGALALTTGADFCYFQGELIAP